MTGKLRKGRAPLRDKIISSRSSAGGRRHRYSANQGSVSDSKGPPAAQGGHNRGSQASNGSSFSPNQTLPGGVQLTRTKPGLPHRSARRIVAPAGAFRTAQHGSELVLLDPPGGVHQTLASQPPCVSAHAPQHPRGGVACVRASTAPATISVLTPPCSRPWTANLKSFTTAQLASKWSVDLPFGNEDGHPAWHSRPGTCSRRHSLHPRGAKQHDAILQLSRDPQHVSHALQGFSVVPRAREVKPPSMPGSHQEGWPCNAGQVQQWHQDPGPQIRGASVLEHLSMTRKPCLTKWRRAQSWS